MQQQPKQSDFSRFLQVDLNQRGPPIRSNPIFSGTRRESRHPLCFSVLLQSQMAKSPHRSVCNQEPLLLLASGLCFRKIMSEIDPGHYNNKKPAVWAIEDQADSRRVSNWAKTVWEGEGQG
eukprot:TRINITY_DN10162_c1_g1_i1.p2 TRINITY_DN10162_c1_g1~~TRINITY_DN10162_c1_g1_i1.p2  ORF type:complete len:121 (-),score=23.62 TRINITY_DN10162_c1_g1_i1:14-376(-)